MSGDTFGRPIHGQREVSGYPSPSELNYWLASEGIYIKPNSQAGPTEPSLHDEL